VALFRKAAFVGNSPDAHYILGMCYQKGGMVGWCRLNPGLLWVHRVWFKCSDIKYDERLQFLL
jgi:hypothetical protein